MTLNTLMTVEEVAGTLRLSPKTVRRYAVSGDLRASKLGQEWRFDPADVQAFLVENQNRDRRKRRRSAATYRALRDALTGPGRTD